MQVISPVWSEVSFKIHLNQETPLPYNKYTEEQKWPMI